MQVTERHGSVVVLRCAQKLDTPFLQLAIEGFERELRRGERYACIVDTTGVEQLPGPNERKLLAAWMNDPRIVERQRQVNLGSSTVVSNVAMRSVLTAIYWLWTPPTIQHAARDLDDAIAFCLGRLEAEKVPLGLPEAELRRRVTSAPRAAAATLHR